MPATLTVGEFSRLTHLPVKTLHHYHQVEVLIPALVDPATGYRRYAPEQVPTAHLARRLREVGMPLEEVRAVLAAPDRVVRDAGIAVYLDRRQRELEQAAAAVATLRLLLGPTEPTGAISRRDRPEQRALALIGNVGASQIGAWCAQAYPRLFQALGAAAPDGPGGALYHPSWFEQGGGEVTAYLPIDASEISSPANGFAGEEVDRIQLITLPAVREAVAVHAGPYRELDRTYGSLGRYVLEHGIGAEGPIRERYLVAADATQDEAAFRTEVCWPVTD